MKKILLLLLLLLIVGCIQQPQTVTKTEEVEQEEIQPIQEEPESIIETEPINEEEPEVMVLRRQGIEAKFEAIKKEAGKICFYLSAADYSADRINHNWVDSSKWFLYISDNGKNLILPSPAFQEIKKDERSWSNKYCIDEKELPESYFKDRIFIVYSIFQPGEVSGLNSIGDLTKKERTFLFKEKIK